MPSSRKNAKSKGKIKDSKAAEDEDVSEEGKEQSETSFIQSPEGGRLTSPNTLFGEDGEESTHEFISPELLGTLECIFPERESLQDEEVLPLDSRSATVVQPFSLVASPSELRFSLHGNTRCSVRRGLCASSAEPGTPAAEA